jgi:hypothetical protein
LDWTIGFIDRSFKITRNYNNSQQIYFLECRGRAKSPSGTVLLSVMSALPWQPYLLHTLGTHVVNRFLAMAHFTAGTMITLLLAGNERLLRF